MKTSLRLVVSLLVLLVAAPAQAGLYSDDLGKCLVKQTSPRDKADLVRWLFSVMALHPEVADLASISAEQRKAANQRAGRMIERLLTVSCESEAREALRYEGQAALGTAFELLGKVASLELMGHPDARAGISEFARYIDEDKIKRLSEGTAAAPAGAP